MTSSPSEDSDQSGHPPSLISLCCPHVEAFSSWLPTECTADSDQTGCTSFCLFCLAMALIENILVGKDKFYKHFGYGALNHQNLCRLI